MMLPRDPRGGGSPVGYKAVMRAGQRWRPAAGIAGTITRSTQIRRNETRARHATDEAQIPLRTEYQTVSDDAIAERNVREGRHLAAAFLPVDAALARLRHPVPGVPQKIESLREHPDERVRAAFGRSVHGYEGNDIDDTHAVRRALAEADAAGVLWTRTLDALAGGEQFRLFADEGYPRVLERRGAAVHRALASADTPTNLERVVSYQSALMARCAARSRHLTSRIVSQLLEPKGWLHSVELVVWQDLLANPHLSSGLRSALVEQIQCRLLALVARPWEWIEHGNAIIHALTGAIQRGLRVGPEDVASLANALGWAEQMFGGVWTTALDAAVREAVSACAAALPATALTALFTAKTDEVRALGLELLARCTPARPAR